MNLDVVCYFHAPDKGRLVLEVIVPATRQARAAGVSARVERHWRHGPHVRIALQGPAALVAPAATAAADAVRAGLAAQPSGSTASAAELLAASERAGRAELVPGPYAPIRPDNTVLVESPDRAHLERLLGADAVPVRDALLADGLELMDELAARSAGGGAARIAAALTVLTCHATAYRPGATGGAMSFLSHLEDHLHHHDGDGRQRAAFERLWERQAELVAERCDRLLSGTAEDTLAAAARAWSHAAVATAARADVPLLPGRAYAAAAEGFADPAVAQRWAGTSLSAFHQHVAPQFAPHAVAADFGPYRFATNVLYQVLLVGDVRPVERYAAAHLLSRAMARRTGVDYQPAAVAS